MPSATSPPTGDRSPADRKRVVLVHGFAQTGRCWGALPVALEGEGFDVVAPDLPGHGDSGLAASDLPRTAEQVRLAAATGRSRPAGGAAAAGADGSGTATYLGYSFGGRVCLRLAVDHPGAVERLVLVGATAGIDDPGERAARRAADQQLASELEAGGLDRFLDRWLALPLFVGLTDATRYRDERRRNTVAGLAGSLRCAGTGAQTPLWDRLDGLSGIPVLLVTGEHDRKFAALADRLAAGIGPSAERLVIPGAGHTAHLEQPDAFLAGLLPWLART